MRVLGCMSGTSADGIDIACADLSMHGQELLAGYRGLTSVPFSPALRSLIGQVLPPARPGAGAVCELHAELGRAYARAFATARDELAVGQADLAVLHGQTVFHWVSPEGTALGTLQVGSAAEVAAALGIPVVSDLRSRDLASGGQGAPLVAMFDKLLLSGERHGGTAAAAAPRAAANLGGIANLTVVANGEVQIGYDVGPAGALMDPAAALASGGTLAFDDGGKLAAVGTVSPELLARLRADRYYQLRPPRSTGREHFNASYLDAALAGLHPAPTADGVCATVTRLLVDLLADAARRHGLSDLVLSGGGSQNATTLAWLRAALPGTAVRTSDELGVPAQAKEALAFAVLGYLTWHSLPGSVPAATGARTPSVLGSITPGAGPLVLPPPAGVAPAWLRLG
jgi:anhydro-N-acetylmuramic acid kinase